MKNVKINRLHVDTTINTMTDTNSYRFHIETTFTGDRRSHPAFIPL